MLRAFLAGVAIGVALGAAAAGVVLGGWRGGALHVGTQEAGRAEERSGRAVVGSRPHADGSSLATGTAVAPTPQGGSNLATADPAAATINDLRKQIADLTRQLSESDPVILDGTVEDAPFYDRLPAIYKEDPASPLHRAFVAELVSAVSDPDRRRAESASGILGAFANMKRLARDDALALREAFDRLAPGTDLRRGLAATIASALPEGPELSSFLDLVAADGDALLRLHVLEGLPGVATQARIGFLERLIAEERDGNVLSALWRIDHLPRKLTGQSAVAFVVATGSRLAALDVTPAWRGYACLALGKLSHVVPGRPSEELRLVSSRDPDPQVREFARKISDSLDAKELTEERLKELWGEHHSTWGADAQPGPR